METKPVSKYSITDKNGKTTLYELVDDLSREQIATEAILREQAISEAVSSFGDGLQVENKKLYLTHAGDKVDDGVDYSPGLGFDGGYQDSDGFVHLTYEGVDVEDFIPFYVAGGGGGGGGGNNAVMSLTDETGWKAKTVGSDEDVNVTLTWSSIENNLPTGPGTMSITVGSTLKATQTVQQGQITVNLKPYLSSGNNTVKIKILDTYGNGKATNYTVSVVSISLSSTFDPTVIRSTRFLFPYTPVGNVLKTVHFFVDGEEIGTTVTSVSGNEVSYLIPRQTHGPHTISCYFECEINGTTVRSNELYYAIICIVDGDTTPIITSAYRETSVSQYETIYINYMVYNPESLTQAITIAANGTEIYNITVDRSNQVLTYRSDVVGPLDIVIDAGAVQKTFNLTVTESEINVDPITDSLELHLTSAGRSNHEENPAQWSYGDISATFEGFTWTSDGWVSDSDGNTVLRVTGDDRVTIPFLPFEENCTLNGKTIEIEFSTRNVEDYEATVISCISDDVGFTVGAQVARLASEQIDISTEYKEDEHIRLSFVVEKRGGSHLVNLYINGYWCGAKKYDTSDSFRQTSPVGISIGNDNCTVDIYNIRVYATDLTYKQVLTNRIADSQDLDDMIDCYKRNQIYDDYGNVDIEHLPNNLPYMVIQMPQTPQYKGDKKICTGYYVDPLNPSMSYHFENCQIDVQGTSSQYYPRKNWKMKYKSGFQMDASGQTESKYALNSDQIPVSTFCMKADVASSESANNTVSADLFNEFNPYRTPAQQENEKIRQTIYGFPCVMFWENSDTGEMTFLGKYNFNNDKSTEDTFGFEDGDESWEIKDNGYALAYMKTSDFSNWEDVFEARFPDTDPAYSDISQLQEFVSWVASTDTEQATGNTIEAVTYDGTTYTEDTAEYRLAKFKNELSNYCDVQSAIQFREEPVQLSLSVFLYRFHLRQTEDRYSSSSVQHRHANS